MLAGESKTNIVFRQQHPAEPFPYLRLVVTYPKQFCQCEISERWIAGKLDNFVFTNFRVEPVALRLRTLVTPDQCRTQDLIVLIQQNRAVHLPGKPDRGNVRSVKSRGRDRLAHSRPSGPIPILWILLCPASFWRCKWGMLAGCRIHYLTALIGEHRSGSAGPN